MGQAKIGARWIRAGEEAEVSAEELDALVAAGLVEPRAAVQTDAADTTVSQQGDDRALIEQLAQDVVAAQARAQDAEAKRDMLQARVTELEAQLTAAASANADTPPVAVEGTPPVPSVDPVATSTRKPAKAPVVPDATGSAS